ncbi:MAG: T9SS type A sorting domain-containing protein, partial [Flavobacteriales bacterium]
VEQCIGLHEGQLPAIEFFPNPFAEELYVQTGGIAADVVVRSSNGMLVWSGKISGRANLDARQWAPGVYFIEFHSGSNTLTKRVVKV